MLILGVDPSVTQCGLALYRFPDNERDIECSSFTSQGDTTEEKCAWRDRQEPQRGRSRLRCHLGVALLAKPETDARGAGGMMTILSLGAGVQSSTMALMAAEGWIKPMPDCAIFADTGWEPAAVYRHLDWLMPQLPFPVHRVSAGNIRDGLVAGSKGHRWASIPAFVQGGIPIRRQCTKEYKIVPIRRKVRELLGIVGRRSPKEPAATQWIGISWDEASRMKPAYERWWANRWPLIELRMSRWDCLRWLERHGYPEPPKSSCIGCPFHDNALWRDMKINRPQEFADAVEIDLLMRPAGPGFKALSKKAYLHRSCQPLDQVNFDNAEDRGQLNLFINECEGMCGV